MRKVKSIEWNKRLRKAREAMDLSLSQAVKLLYECHKVKLSKSHLAKIERAETDCTVTKFRGLCDIYSVDPKWILDLKD